MYFSARWAVGVLIYEMIAGYPPFYDEDRVAMFKNICQVKYSVPSHFSKVRWPVLPWPGAWLGASPWQTQACS